MIKAIQADFYRLLRSKGYWITQIAMLAFLTLTVYLQAIGGVGINTESPQEALSAVEAMQAMTWTSEVSLTLVTSMASMLIYFCLPLFVMIIGHDLTRKTYKNILTTGLSRISFFLSKFVVFMVIMACQFLLFYGWVCLIAGIKNGFGNLDADFVQHIFMTMGYQYLNMLAIFAISTLVMYLLYSNVSVVMATVILPLVLTITQMFLKWKVLDYINFQTNIDQAFQIEASSELFRNTMLGSLATIGLSLVIASYLFKKKSL